MAHTRYQLDEFIHDMTNLVAAKPDQATLFDRGSRFIERLVRDPDSVPAEYRQPAPRGRRPGGGSYLLHRGPGIVGDERGVGAGLARGPSRSSHVGDDRGHG